MESLEKAQQFEVTNIDIFHLGSLFTMEFKEEYHITFKGDEPLVQRILNLN
jgi:hypothetical protein